MATTDTNMNKITFILSLVSASLTVTAASAAVQNSNEVVDLPAYTVKAARYTDAEKSIADSLAAFRASAQPTQTVRTELPSLNTVARQQPAQKADRAIAATLAPRPQARS